jgi:hypothetical protein
VKLPSDIKFWALAICIFASNSFAIFDPDLTGAKTGKRWAITADLRTGYDDNTATSATDPRASAFSSALMSTSYSYPSDTTFVSARASLGGQLYYDRPGSNFDYNYSLDGTLAHTFSLRLNLDVSEHLRFSQEPQLAEGNAILRRQGDHISNEIQMGLAFELTPKWFIDAALNHSVFLYSEDDIAASLDRQSVGGGPSIRFRVTENTTLSANYRFTRIEYDKSPRSSFDNTGSLGVSHNLTRRWKGNVELGGQMRKEDNSLSSSTFYSPFVNGSMSYLLTQTAKVSGGIRYSFQETDVATYFESRSLIGYGRFDWEFAKKLVWGVGLDVVNNDMTDPVVAGSPDINEKTIVFSNKLSWNVLENTDLFLTHSFTKTESDLIGRSYDRSIIMAGASVLF